MKNIIKLLVVSVSLGAAALLTAQDAQPEGPGGQGGPKGPGGPGGQRRPPALIGALDANHDGVIDADEIANASAALKKLDKNGDGKLTPDEFMGPRPGGPGGEGKGRSGDGADHPGAGNRPQRPSDQ